MLPPGLSQLATRREIRVVGVVGLHRYHHRCGCVPRRGTMTAEEAGAAARPMQQRLLLRLLVAASTVCSCQQPRFLPTQEKSYIW